MPAVVRKGDSCSGHGGWPSRQSTSGSPNVLFNGIPAVRSGDSWANHCKWISTTDGGYWSCHSGTTTTGSSKVLVNGKPLMRVGDSVNCGSRASQGSPNVFSN